MVLRSCFACKFHLIQVVEGDQESFCRKENCWARFSKCVACLALEQFISEQGRPRRPMASALEFVYSLDR